MESAIELPVLLSAASFLGTAYLWFVQSRRERPKLDFLQLRDFRAVLRRHPEDEGVKRLCIQQVEPGGVLAVNHSTRQNSIVLFDCFLTTPDGPLQGDGGYQGEDRLPWNIGPESSIAISPACFFDVPEDFQVTDDLEFHVQFITASGKSFLHRFTKEAPRWRSADQRRQAA